MYKKLADKRGTREYDMWFLKYSPALNEEMANKPKKQKKTKKTYKKRGKNMRSKTVKFSDLFK
jgi:hypothetical protein